MYIDNQWELIGTTTIDLSDYVTETELTTALTPYVQTSALTTTLDDRYVNVTGDTMTGGLTITNGDKENCLEITATLSNDTYKSKLKYGGLYFEGSNPSSTLSIRPNNNATKGLYRININNALNGVNNAVQIYGITTPIESVSSNDTYAASKYYVDSQINTVTSAIPTITPAAALTTGITIGSIDVNGTTTTLYAPNADNKLSIGYVENDTIYIPNNISYRLSGDSEYSGIFYFVVPPTGSGSGYYEVTNKTVQYVRWLGQTRTVPVDSYTFTQAGLYSAFINDNQLWECKRVGSSSYALSMTGPTINLLADGVAASTITLPIWDGTLD